MAFLAAAAPILGLVGAGASALGTIESGEATAHAANYQAQVAANNAVIESQNATYAVAAGQQQAANESLKGAATGGKIKTAQAANNIDVNTGSAVNVRKSNAETSELDTETVLNNAELAAYGYRSQATGFTSQSGLETATAEQAPIGADIGAGGSLLSNASSLGFKWSGTQNPGGQAGAPLNILPS